MYFHTRKAYRQCFHKTEMQCISFISAMTLFDRQFVSHLLEIGGQLEAIEHMN